MTVFYSIHLALPLEKALSYSLISSHYSRAGDNLFLCNFNPTFICLQIWV